MTSTFNIIFNSIKILKSNPRIFITIYGLIIFPLSMVLFSLFIISQPIINDIQEKQMAASGVTPYESLGRLREIRLHSRKLMAIQCLFFFPFYVFSLMALITTVNSTSQCYNGKPANPITALKAVMMTWMRPSVTSIFVCGILFGCSILTHVVFLLADETVLEFWLRFVWVVLEVGLMAVSGMGLVVSVLEERFGWDAFCVGWGLMDGKRFSGWSLAGFVYLVTGGIRLGFNHLIDRGDALAVLGNCLLICLLGFVTLSSYVITTVYYNECKKQHVDRVEI
ncbi:hypothetical protein ACHQM5_030278 [Ranunculus cassubicifolius]